MARDIRRPLCEEGKVAFYRIIQADPIVYKTLKNTVFDAFVESLSLCLALAALGITAAMLVTGSEEKLYYYVLPLAAAVFMGLFTFFGRKREREFSRCLADINQTLREDVIVQVHSNPVGGMYENDSYWVMREKGRQTEAFCDKLSEVAENALGLVISISASLFMLILNPFAATPMLILAFFRLNRLFRLRNRYEEALDILDAETEKYNDACDALIRSSQSLEPDDVALSRAKAATPVEEAQAVCVRTSNKLFAHSRIVPVLLLLAAGVLSILIRATGQFLWYSPLAIIPSLILYAVVLYSTSDYYTFNRALADAEWNAIDLTTLPSTEK